MTNYNDGYWHGWNGGECPVHPDTVVEAVWFDIGRVIVQKEPAREFIWDGGGMVTIAFRVVKEHKEPREFWVFINDFGDLCVTDKPFANAIHVREVIE